MPRPAWKLAILTALTALSTTLVHAARPVPVKDYTKQLEVVVGGRLRQTRPGQGEVSVTLYNKTNSAIAGPIFMIVDSTGLPSVTVGSHAEETAEGKPVFQVLPADQQLPPGGMSETLPIAFTMPESLSREEANKLHLETRVFARRAPMDAEQLAREKSAREDADFATRGKKYNQADLNAAMAAQREITPALVAKPDVIATAITEDANGNLALRVYTETRAAAKNLPANVGKYPVEIKPVPGGFRSGPARTTLTSRNGVRSSQKTREEQAPSATTRVVTPVDPTVRFERPVPIGVSSFNGDVGICAAGTLGFRVKDSSGKLYAISNSHVWAENGSATVGDQCVQPSPGDNACASDTANNTIGTLSDFTSYINNITGSRFFRSNTLPMNFIDAALVEVGTALDSTGATVIAVGTSTPSDGYGTPSSEIIRSNRIGLLVQKYGRTTGYTRGITTAVSVYSPIGATPANENTEFYRLDEFIAVDKSAAFSQPGDSGSLIVSMDRRPVSHLFAGGANSVGVDVTLGNRIGAVLDEFNVRIDDGTDAAVTVTGTGTTGLGGRGGIAYGNLVAADLDEFTVTDANGNTLPGLLPPELLGRVRPNGRPLIPASNGYFN